VLLSPNFDHQVALCAMKILAQEIGVAFLRAHDKLERDENQLRAIDSDL
jgi:hypothetical protein